MIAAAFDAVTVTLNPAIDRTVTIPDFSTGAVNRVEAERSQAGGKGVNVASSLADAGHRVAATGFLGRENTAVFEVLFRRKGIVDRFVRIDGETRVGIKIVDPRQRQTTDINFPGAPATAEELATFLVQLRELDSATFVIAGSVPPGVGPEIYRQLTEDLRSRGKRVVLDASGDAARLALTARPHVLKPNADELGELLARKLETNGEIVAAARELVRGGVDLVVVSMGKEGACFVNASEALVATPPEVEVRSTVGAGDAMVAGIVSSQTQGLSLAETARRATAFSVRALTASEQGGDFAALIERIAREVEVAQIE